MENNKVSFNEIELFLILFLIVYHGTYIYTEFDKIK